MKSLFLSLFILFASFVDASEQRHCIILLDQDEECEHVGTEVYFLMSKLQSALQEKSSPILVSAGLWHSFVERLIHYRQNCVDEDMPYYKIDRLYKNINKMIHELSLQRVDKKQIVQRVNQEFYKKQNYVSGYDYQLILAHYTPLSKDDWKAYTNNKGYYLFVPNGYPDISVDGLDELLYPEDPVYLYLQTRTRSSFIDSLEDFFSGQGAYEWTIALAGHGGNLYREQWKDGKVVWQAEPIICDLTISEFQTFLEFLDTRLHTHLLHYSGCYSGGNHIALAFDRTYSYPIICDALTDVASVCKKRPVLPSTEKKYLSVDDLKYDREKGVWHLPLPVACEWGQFFQEIGVCDFSLLSIETLPDTLSLITNPAISNIALLRLAESNTFFPIHNSTVHKLELYEDDKKPVELFGTSVLLIEDRLINREISIRETPYFRMISIAPGNALHHIKKLSSTSYIDLAATFWQEYQKYDKTFLIDECTFPLTEPSKLFSGKNVRLEKVLIQQQGRKYIRIFCSYKDKVLMFTAKKMVERERPTQILEVVELSDAAREKYEEYYRELLCRNFDLCSVCLFDDF